MTAPARVAVRGTGWHRDGVEGALRGAGFAVQQSSGSSHGDVDVAVAVGDDLDGVVWARTNGVPCVLVRGSRPDARELLEAVMSGADGVVTAESSVDELVSAVRDVIDGRLALSALDARCLVERLRSDVWSARPRIVLTPRQRAVLELIVAGVSVKQTALALGIAVKTVENTQSRLYRRLGVRNRAQAVAVAIAEGLVEVDVAHNPSGGEPLRACEG